MDALVISVNNGKGGVGKTATCTNLAQALARMGAKVLLMDMDPQAGATIASGLQPEKLADRDMLQVLLGRLKLEDILLQAAEPNQYVVAPSTISLASIEWRLQERLTTGKEDIRRALVPVVEEARRQFDFVIIDTQPTFSLLAIMPMVAADLLIVPVATEYLALRGFAETLTIFTRIGKALNSSLKVFTILPTMFDRRNLHSRQMLQSLQRHCRDMNLPVFDPVPASVRFKEATQEHVAIFDLASEERLLWTYTKLAKALMDYRLGLLRRQQEG